MADGLDHLRELLDATREYVRLSEAAQQSAYGPDVDDLIPRLDKARERFHAAHRAIPRD